MKKEKSKQELQLEAMKVHAALFFDKADVGLDKSFKQLRRNMRIIHVMDLLSGIAAIGGYMVLFAESFHMGFLSRTFLLFIYTFTVTKMVLHDIRNWQDDKKFVARHKEFLKQHEQNKKDLGLEDIDLPVPAKPSAKTVN